MSAPMNRGADPTSERVYALIFNGLTAASSAGHWMRLSTRERFAEAVYDALRTGGVEIRIRDGLAELRRVNDELQHLPEWERELYEQPARECRTCLDSPPQGFLCLACGKDGGGE